VGIGLRMRRQGLEGPGKIQVRAGGIAEL